MPFDSVQGEGPSTGLFADGKAFYLPPETYTDPAYIMWNQVLNPIEQCQMRIEVRSNGSLVASKPFILRRPPLVLVHGIMSDPSTWDPGEWNEAAGAPVPTRVYYADWSATSTKGYSENYGVVALMIEQALEEYRTANNNGHAAARGFNGVRFAATRADVVAHSQGGQITRFYMADGIPVNIDRVGWLGDADNHRSEGDSAGHWPYLRSSNWGAGSIRRFITLGSPFKGSPIANAAASFFALGDPGQPPISFTLLNALWESGALHAQFPELATTLYTGPPPGGTYIEPTCLSDLSVGSELQLALESATYPALQRQVRWLPCVGIATEDPGEAPVQATLWELLYTLIPVISNDPTAISQLSPANSDLIVPAPSQRNSSGAGHPNELAGLNFAFTAHSAVPNLLPGETNSTPIRVTVAELLSGWPSVYNPLWSIGP